MNSDKPMGNLRSEDEIIASWKGDICNPVVSICCITYNHEHYIEDSLKGFLLQETDFPFEILIHDDASSDRTADIIREYTARYPKLIKPLYQKENQYSKGLKPNPAFNFPRAGGEYIALCEGDDYWVDSQKLQKQVDCMEQNSNVVLCFGRAKIIDEEGKLISEAGPGVLRDLNSWDLLTGAMVNTLTVLFRKDKLGGWGYLKHSPIGDLCLYMVLSEGGDAAFIKNLEESSYRLHKGGILSMKSRREKRMMQLIHYSCAFVYCVDRRKVKAALMYFFHLLAACKFLLLTRNNKD